VRTPELVNLQGALAYEVVLKQGAVYIDANTGAVLLNKANTPQSSTRLTPDQAAQIAAKVVPNAQLVRTPELVNLQGALAYEVVLKQGVVYIDANTGAVLLNRANTPQSSTRLTPDQAAQIAAKVVPNAQLVRTPELVNLQGTLAYEVVLNQGVVYIDANTGAVLFNGANAPANAPQSSTSNNQGYQEHKEKKEHDEHKEKKEHDEHKEHEGDDDD